MNCARAFATAAGLMFACIAVAEQADAPLQRNPFAAPESVQQPVAIATPPSVAQPTPPEPEPQFVLHAVLAAGRHSLANIDGTILGVGEKIDSYRVTAIHEHQVVLKSRDDRIVLSVFEQDEVADGR